MTTGQNEGEPGAASARERLLALFGPARCLRPYGFLAGVATG
jgi:hypothetical protein